MMHCSHLPKLIKEHFKVDHLTFETSDRGLDILYGNPYVDKMYKLDTDNMTHYELMSRWEYHTDSYDLFFNLMHTIESSYCLLETDMAYYRDSNYRREKFGRINYYDAMTESCGLPESYFGTRGQLYYGEKCHEDAEKWVKAQKEKFGVNYIILVCLSGSSLHKRFQQAESISRKILEKYPQALIVLTGDKDCLLDVFEGERILSKVDKWNFRTVALMSKYFDLVISPETGLVCISHSWDTPTIQLLTAASWENHIKYAKNAYWVQSEAYCSPCHKSPQRYYGCPTKERLPACVFFNEDKIMSKVEEAYVNRPTPA